MKYKELPVKQSEDEENDLSLSHCSDLEPYALQVIGDSMEPEFPENCIIIIEPATCCDHGVYVVIEYDNETWFRQLIKHNGKEYLKALHPGYPDIEMVLPYRVIGVITQRNIKRKIKHYDIHPQQA